MATFILTVEASTDLTAGTDPLLEVLVNGVVTSSASITAQTGVGTDILVFTLDFDDSVNNYPSSLSLRFNGSSGDGNETVTLHSVNVNGQSILGDLTSTMLAQSQSSNLSSPASVDHVFGREEPTSGDLGAATQTGTGAAETLAGDTGDDVIDGGGGGDRIEARAGDDAIIGGALADELFGQEGNDVVIGGGGDDLIYGNEGDDLLFGQADNDRIFGGDGNDMLNGGAGDDFLNGNAGNDVLYGEAGNDRLIGFSGNNVMYGDAGNDIIIGGRDDDIIYGGDDNDIMHGGGGNDTLDGGAGNDVYTGAAGNDTFMSSAGTDTFRGGTGTDTLDYSNAAAGITVDLSAGTASDDGDGGTDNIFEMEIITATGFADSLTGDANANTLNGGDGNDTLAGRGGVDVLNGGNDTDTADYSNAAAGVTSSLASGTTSDDGDGSNDTLTDIENLTGSAFDDDLTGDGSANTIIGNDGDDTISGGGSNDILDGGNGDDTIDGGANADTITGGIGNDILNGSSGSDTIYALDNGISAADADDGNTNVLNGGAGIDTLYGSTGLDILSGGDDDDTLYSGAAGTIITVLDNSFASDAEDFAYTDGGFGGTDPASFADVDGTYDGTDGNTANGSLYIHVDQTNNNKAFTNASGTWDTTISSDVYLTNVSITFSYRHQHDANNDAGEDSQVYFEFEGTTLDDTGGNSFLSELTGAGATTDTGWVTVTIDLPDLAAGSTYDLSIGIIHLGSDRTDEDAYLNIDDVTIIGNTGIFNELNGDAGQDDLYGNDGGTDHFAFTTGESDDNDQIYNFNLADQDAIDLVSVLNAVGYESVTDNITNYIRITDSGSDSIVEFDSSGLGLFISADTIATIIGVTGLTDEAALEADGTLITPLVTLDIIGTSLPDTLNGTGAGESIGGLASDDLLYGGGGNDDLYGFAGSDTAYYASAGGAVTASLATGTASNDGDGGSDTFNSIENLTGSAFGDNLTGDSFANILTGLGGNDTLSGGDGNDTLAGGVGNDSLTGGNGTDTADYTNAAGAVTASIAGGGTSAGADGDGGTDTYTTIENITGSAYNDSLTGDANANVLSGLAGNDTLIGNGGTDTLDGGAGTDTADYSGAAAGVTVNLNAGAASDDGDGSADTLIAIENVTGSGSADTLIGDANDNTILGGNGNDSLSGRGGTDTLNGGGGTDTADYISATSGVTANLSTNNAANDGDGGTDTFVSIENLTGSNFNDFLTGDGTANVLTGNVGSDNLVGGGGADTLYALGNGVTVATTFINQNFAAGLGTFSFTGGGTYFTNSLDANDNDGNNSAHINLGRNGGPPSSTYTNLTGTYSSTITFTQDTENVELSLFYDIIATDLDTGENPVMNIIFNGVTVFTDSVTANGGTVDSGWLSTGTISLGDFAAGTYTLQLQGVQSSSNRNEDADFYFDQVLLTGDVGSSTGDAAYTNTLNGGDDQDNLYGSDGIDIFVFDDGYGNDDDQIVNFTSGAGNDAIDISDILFNAGYDSATDAITDFVQITTVGADSELRIDTSGSASFGGTALATIIGVTGLTDEATLEADGNLIT